MRCVAPGPNRATRVRAFTMDSFVVLGTLPRGHALRTAPLGPLGVECRNLLCKEWRCVARWAIASAAYDDLGEAWTRTSEFRVRTRTCMMVAGETESGMQQ